MAAAHHNGAFGRCRFKRIQCVRRIKVNMQSGQAGVCLIFSNFLLLE